MSKKFALVVALLLALAMLFPASAMADSAQIGENIIIRPMWTYISYVDNYFSINGSGLASMWAEIGASSSTDSVTIYSYLQQLNGGSWVTYKSWSSSYSGDYGFWSKTYYVPSGYYYRLRNSFYAYDNGNSENTTLTSPSDYY